MIIRHLTELEKKLLIRKGYYFSYNSKYAFNELIHLGNGNNEEGITGLLPVNFLFCSNSPIDNDVIIPLNTKEKRSFYKEHFEYYKKIEDNPVPSLDNLADNIIQMFGQPKWTKGKLLAILQNGVENSNEQPSLIKNYNDHPEWCKNNKSLEYFENFRLGEFIWYNGDKCQIIHIGYNGINNAPSFRLKLNSGASITGHYNYISKN